MQRQKQNKVVLDSSVISAIFFREEASERAEKVAENYKLITLDFAAVEVANVAWKRVIFFSDSKEIVLRALKKNLEFINNVCEIIASKELIEDAFEIAVSDEITIYDSLFIAASEREKVSLLTTDKKLYEKLEGKRNIKLI
ncbi:MAG: type II toxin-antitoxin system VapC family toxin [Methanocellales archaeon]